MNASAIDKHAWYVSQHGYPNVGYGFACLNEPTVKDAVADMLWKCPKRIIVLPVFMYKCRTVTEVIPEILSECDIDVPVLFAEPLGTDELLFEDLDRKVPEGW